MEFEALPILALVFALAVVQSLFGVGLLVFGTPCLLAAGLPFVDALCWLLPASFAISLVQIQSTEASFDGFRKDFVTFAVPPTALTLAVATTYGPGYDARFAIGLMLLGSAFLRALPRAAVRVGGALSAYRRIGLVLAGLVHGATNMGGAVLTVLVPGTASNKDKIRGQIAFGYLVFVGTQLFVLASDAAVRFEAAHAGSPVVALLAYVTLGRKVFRGTSEAGYARALTGFTMAFGLMLVGATML